MHFRLNDDARHILFYSTITWFRLALPFFIIPCAFNQLFFIFILSRLP
jgi:hypothetical protein